MTALQVLEAVALVVGIAAGVALVVLAVRLLRVADQVERTAAQAERALGSVQSLADAEVRDLLAQIRQNSRRVDELISQWDVVPRLASGAERTTRAIRSGWESARAAGVGLAAGIKAMLASEEHKGEAGDEREEK